MGMKSVDRLRDHAMVNWDPWPAARERLEKMADAIEAEVAEWYVPLPIGSDCKPIRLGETVYGSDGHEWRVTRIRIGRNHSVRATDGTEAKALRPEWLTHDKPPTVEGLLREFFEEVGDGLHTINAVDTRVIIARYAAKLRLAEGGEG